MPKRTLLAVLVSAAAIGRSADAHFVLVSPPMTTPQPAPGATPNDAQSGKGAPPCGSDPIAATPTPAQGGHPLSLMISETTRHGGFYRIALALKSRSELPVDNVVYDSANRILPPSGTPSGISDHADVQKPAVFPVLADGMFAHDQVGAPAQPQFTGDVMLPNVSCDHCTLQVIEFMTPHGFNTGGGYFYHHCADLKITADPALPPFMAGADGGAADAANSDAAKADGPAADVARADATTTDAGSDASQPGTGGVSGTGGATPPGSGGAPVDAGAATGGKSGTDGGGSGGGGGGGCGCAVTDGAPATLLSISLVALIVLARRRRRRRA